MTRRDPVTWVGLFIVLAAAAVLSFHAIRDLGITVGIPVELAWLLPIAVDAGAAVSCRWWLSPDVPDAARRFAQRMTWSLLAVSVVGNAAAGGLAAARIVPPWWAASVVFTVAAGVVGTTVHLAMLVRRGTDGPAPSELQPAPEVAAALHAVEDEPTASELPDRRPAVNTKDLREVIDDLRRLSVERDRRWSRDQIIAMYGISADRAMTARKTLGWPGLPTAPTGTDS